VEDVGRVDTMNSFEGCRGDKIPAQRSAHQNPGQYWTFRVNGAIETGYPVGRVFELR